MGCAHTVSIHEFGGLWYGIPDSLQQSLRHERGAWKLPPSAPVSPATKIS
jgi:hypothetical protein